MTIARTVVVVFILLFIGYSFSGCTDEPTAFSLNQEIPMGSFKLVVSKYTSGTVGEYIPKEIVPAGSYEKILEQLGSMKRDFPALVVFFSYSGDGNEASLSLLTTFNSKMFYIMNKNRDKIYPVIVLPKRFLFMGEGWIMDYDDMMEAMDVLKESTDFFCNFGPEKGSSGFTLFVKNPSQKLRQAGIASLPLGS